MSPAWSAARATAAVMSSARDVRRHIDHEQGIDLARCEQEPGGTLEDGRSGRRDEVDGVLHATCRCELVQRGLQWWRQLGHLESRGDAGVGGDDRRATAVAHHRDPSAGRDRLVRDERRDVEQLLERVDPDDPRLAEECVDGGVGIRERGGVRRRAARAGGGPAALERDDRLPAGESPREACELPRVAERLEVQEHDVGLGIVGPVLQQVVAARRRPCCPSRRTSRCRDRARARARAARCRRHPTATRSRRARAPAATGENVAFMRMSGSVLTTPTQFGPDEAHARSPALRGELLLDAVRPPARRTHPRSRPVRARPSPHTARPPRRTSAAGTATTARSTGPGMSRTLGYVGRPAIVAACGLTGWTAPVKPPWTRLSTIGATDRAFVRAGADDGDRPRAEQSRDGPRLGDVVALLVGIEPAFGGHQLEVDAADAARHRCSQRTSKPACANTSGIRWFWRR